MAISSHECLLVKGTWAAEMLLLGLSRRDGLRACKPGHKGQEWPAEALKPNRPGLTPSSAARVLSGPGQVTSSP